MDNRDERHYHDCRVMPRVPGHGIILALVLLLPAVLAYADQPSRSDLHRFLPNGGNSVYEVDGLLRSWPGRKPEELWRAEIGWGKSAVVEANGRAFTATETDEKQWAVCLDPETGRVLWKKLLFPEPNRHFAWGPSTSPIIDGNRVYFIPYATFEDDVWEMRCPVFCFTMDGEEIWRRDTEIWATEASTPLIEGDTLYVGADNPQRAVLMALNKHSGKLLWSVIAESNKKRELGAPASLTYQVVDSIPQVIVGTYGTRELLGVHAKTGKIMWRYPYPADIILGLVSTPVATGSRLFVSGGEGKRKNFSALLEMNAVDGEITVREVYQSTELQNNMYNTVAIYQEAVFGFGGNDRAGFLHCTNLKDGELLWKDAGRQWTCEQNLIIADGLLFALNNHNELVMAEASREGYHELGRIKVPVEMGRPQQPTIANGRMYLRGKEAVVCYRVGE
ncbi:MAG: PQQ-binding-like beta-propeller repeat protein [Planctomycetota bacterium]